MTDYVDQVDLEAYLGRTLTAEEVARLAVVAPAVTARIDRYTGHSWQGESVATTRTAMPLDRTILLDWAPIASVETVRTRSPEIGSAWVDLIDGETYELLDAGRGLVAVSTWCGWMVEVAYTVGSALPEPVHLAAQMLASAWLAGGGAAGSAGGAGSGITRFSVDGETVEYAGASSGGAYGGGLSFASGLPPEVTALLDAYKLPAVVA